MEIQLGETWTLNLDESIIALLRKHKGRVSRTKMWDHFDNYSKGYLHGRLQALKYSGLIEEVWGWYMLTDKGRSARFD